MLPRSGPPPGGPAAIMFAADQASRSLGIELLEVGEGDVRTATAQERVTYGRSGIYDVTVSRGAEVVAEFRGRSRTLA